MSPTKTTSHRNETILLVEDEANLRRLACQYLKTQGYTVLEAADGAAAVQLCVGHRGEVDLLLTDIIMPGMNGHALAKRIISLRPNAKVLYMTGYAENAIVHNGTLDPGVNLLQKPFSLQSLKEKVREVLDSATIASNAGLAASRRASTRIPSYRAQRYKMELPLRYRPIGEAQWREGTTENISRSGLLFRVAETLPMAVQLEISMVLPPEIAGLASAEVVCRGEIVRTVAAESAAMNPSLAAKILQYQFQKGSQIADA
jgi:CheY-like chemotaxis protein